MTRSEDVELTQVAAHLMARYAWAIDDRAWFDLHDVFTADVAADYGAFTCHGADELAARMEEIHQGLRTTQHLVGSVVARGGPDGSASVLSHVRATLVRGSGASARVEVAASYRDTMVRTPSGPRIAERHVEGRWISGERSILPWFHEPSRTSEGLDPAGASDVAADGRRVDRSQTASAVPRSTRPDDRGI